MAPTTYASFVAGLAGVEIAGVTRQYTYPPPSLNAADLPASWAQLPRGESGALTFQANGGWPLLRADLVVAVEAVAQGQQSGNFAATLAMMDAVADALRGADISRGPLSWDIRQDEVEVAGTRYWAVVATVEGRG